ncbi:MAG: DinB/UmuC family translesion DNA polymerase, partial [Gemmatimonadaceae bacterium]
MAPRLVALTPRVVVEPRGLMWCDAQGLDASRVAYGGLELVRGHGDAPAISDAYAGVARTPIAAEVAAMTAAVRASVVNGTGPGEAVTIVPPGGDAGFLATHPIEVLGPSPHLCSLLRGSGVERCGDLAALDHESVEVRFAAEGSRIWRLARADDRRRLFPPLQRTLPGASFEWLDYVLSEPERLLFVINGLMSSVCEQLGDRGAGAREIALVFSLANRSTYEHRLRPARITASQRAWMRLVRSELERIALPDAVTGISLSVLSMGGELQRQGDLFDRGFASARATEQTLAQLLDDRGSRLLTSRNSAHPLVDRRT